MYNNIFYFFRSSICWLVLIKTWTKTIHRLIIIIVVNEDYRFIIIVNENYRFIMLEQIPTQSSNLLRYKFQVFKCSGLGLHIEWCHSLELDARHYVTGSAQSASTTYE